MKHLNCHTVEQLAGMSDGTLSTAGMMGLHRFREKAIKHLAEHQNTSAFDEVKAENVDLKERLEKLEALMTNQAAVGSEEAYKAIETATANQSGSLHGAPKRKAGRPRKDA